MYIFISTIPFSVLFLTYSLCVYMFQTLFLFLLQVVNYLFIFSFNFSISRVFTSLCWSRFSSYIIFLRPKEFPLTVLVVQVCWQWTLLAFVCLKKSYFTFIFERPFHWVKNSDIFIFLSVLHSCHCSLPACIVSDNKSLCSSNMYSAPFFKNLWEFKLFSSSLL